jgi:hypothetical protein
VGCGFLGGGWLFWVMGLLLGVDLLVGMEDVGGLWWPGVEGGYGDG